MLQADMAMSSIYDVRLVALSIAIAVLASYTALALAGRVTAAYARARLFWLVGGAIAMGLGIWSMHFVAMLAFRLPMPIAYDVRVVVLSILPAIVASGGALFLASRLLLSIQQLLIGGVFMGLGIASMHYIGMAAMRMPARTQYDPLLFILSIAIAIGASIVALQIAFQLRADTSKTRKWLRIGSALIMGAAISGMHYTGMAAANFKPTQNVATFASQATSTSLTWLAAAIGIATLVLLGFALMTSFVDQRLTAQAKLIEQQEVEQARVQLFSTITLRIRESLNYDEILETAVVEIRKALFTDRVVVYRFDSDWRGTVVAESVVPGWTQALNEQIEDPCFKEHHIEKYEAGRVLAIDNIYQAGLTSCHIKTLEQFEVKANLVAPILKDKQLLGLLIAHHCLAPRSWQKHEIDLFRQLALQVGFALDQANLLEQQEVQSRQARLFTEIATSRARNSQDLESVFNQAITGARKILKADRVVIYRFHPDWSGYIAAESVAAGWPSSLGDKIEDACIGKSLIEAYTQGRVVATNNVLEAGLAAEHQKLLRRLQVKANLVTPVLKDGQLFGLLIAHHCYAPHAWQNAEVNFLAQLAIQLGLILDRVVFLEQMEQARHKAEVLAEEQRQQKESLQLQLLELLSDIEGAARGDLTVRAEVTVGEIGIVGDFFNAIIESLRQIVTSVKKAASEVNVSVGKNSGAIQQLADQALQQAQEINHTLDSVEQMSLSIQAVADSAHQAAVVARTASTTAEAGGQAMEYTVSKILNLQQTVAETANKVRRLGAASQEISKVVSLINQIALQTNVLSINASVEAARAGEQGRGFAVVAEEVGQLAAQSAQATQEIQQIVENIQLETSAVVQAMELGTTQVVEGAYLVKDAKHSLGQILEVSRQIDELVQSISHATVSQAQTSQAVAILMKQIAQASERTSDSSHQVSSSLLQTVEVAQQLQASVGVFKIGA